MIASASTPLINGGGINGLDFREQTTSVSLYELMYNGRRSESILAHR